MSRFSERHAIGRRTARAVPALVLLTAVIGVPDPALAENTVVRWTEHAMQAVRTANVGTPAAGRLYAMVTVAIYDAVNGIDGI
jgi:hypothetical protein